MIGDWEGFWFEDCGIRVLVFFFFIFMVIVEIVECDCVDVVWYVDIDNWVSVGSVLFVLNNVIFLVMFFVRIIL